MFSLSPLILGDLKFPSTPSTNSALDPKDKAVESGLGTEIHPSKRGVRVTFFFPHGGTELLEVHRQLLETIASGLKSSHVLEMYSNADRTGTQGVNYRVTAARLKAVKDELMANKAPFQLVTSKRHKAFGEDFTATLEKEDGKKFPEHRNVVAYIWNDLPSSETIFKERLMIKFGRSHKQPF
jgi:hypothetical protein